MPAVLCISANAVPESDEMRRLTGKAAHPSAGDDSLEGVVMMDAWEAAGNLAPGFTWDNKNDWAMRALAPNRRLDAVLVAEPRAGGKGQVVKAELFGDDVVLTSSLGAMPTAMWPRLSSCASTPALGALMMPCC